MKKKFAFLIAAVMMASAATNCFAYTKTKDMAYVEEYDKYVPNDSYDNSYTLENTNEMYYRDYCNDRRHLNGGDFRTTVITDEYKLLNGKPMVKYRDIVGAMGGKIDYNPQTKVSKAYFTCTASRSIRSIALSQGNNRVDFSVASFEQVMQELENKTAAANNTYYYGSCNFEVTPTIIDGSLYVYMNDIERILGRYYVDYDNKNVTFDNDDSRYVARFKNNIVYIPIFDYLP